METHSSPEANMSFFPDVLFEEGEITSIERPELISDLPVYNFKEFVQRCVDNGELLDKYCSLSAQPLEYAGAGQDGSVVTLEMGDKALALKTIHGVGLPEELTDNFLTLLGGEVSPYMRRSFVGSDENPPKYREKMLTSEVVGSYLGSIIEPDYVSPPYGILEHNGHIVGFISERIKGTFLTEAALYDHVDEQEYNKVKERLYNGGVHVDNMIDRENFAVELEEDGSLRRAHIFDVSADQQVFGLNPIDLPKGAKYIKRRENERGPVATFMDSSGVVMSVSELYSILEANAAHASNPDLGDINYTYADVYSGDAIILTEEAVREANETFSNYRKVVAEIAKLGIPTDDENMSLNVDENRIRLQKKTDFNTIVLWASTEKDGTFETNGDYTLLLRTSEPPVRLDRKITKTNGVLQLEIEKVTRAEKKIGSAEYDISLIEIDPAKDTVRGVLHSSDSNIDSLVEDISPEKLPEVERFIKENFEDIDITNATVSELLDYFK